MTYDEDERRQAAALLETPIFNRLMSEAEASAIDLCLAAKPEEHEKRAAYALEARVIRDLRRKLNALATGKANSRKSAPV